MSKVVADANVVVRLLTLRQPNPYSLLWQVWMDLEIEVVAPKLFGYEVTNALWRSEKASEISSAFADNALSLLPSLTITFDDDESDHAVALAHARKYQSKTSYDGHYIALALRLGCDFYTADNRLFNTVQHAYPWVHLVGPD